MWFVPFKFLLSRWLSSLSIVKCLTCIRSLTSSAWSGLVHVQNCLHADCLVHLWSVDGPNDPWPCVLSLPERFVGDPASLARDSIVTLWAHTVVDASF